MTNSPLTIEAEGADRLRISRSFAAPPEEVFRAHTEPALVKRWLNARDFPLVTCEIDLRPGGKARYEWDVGGGRRMGMTGTYVEVDRPRHLVHRETFDEDWTGGEVEIRTNFDPAPADGPATTAGAQSERAAGPASHGDSGPGGTVVTMELQYSNGAARDAVLNSPMSDGMEEAYRALDDLLAG